jgi:hypothetical protein
MNQINPSVESFITKLQPYINSQKFENLGNYTLFLFCYDQNYFLMQYSSTKLEWLVPSDSEGHFALNSKVLWDNNEYVGVKTNSLIDTNINLDDLEIETFLNSICLPSQ